MVPQGLEEKCLVTGIGQVSSPQAQGKTAYLRTNIGIQQPISGLRIFVVCCPELLVRVLKTCSKLQALNQFSAKKDFVLKASRGIITRHVWEIISFVINIFFGIALIIKKSCFCIAYRSGKRQIF